MDLVIDANIVSAYFMESVLACNPGLTGSAVSVFERAGFGDTVHLDDTQHIENEWRSVVSPEWFNAWYGDLLINGGAAFIRVETCTNLRRTLEALGFPRSKDIWYIRTAVAVSQRFGSATLVTEDMDFFDPRDKLAPSVRRSALLRAASGRVCRRLRKHERIRVTCVARLRNE